MLYLINQYKPSPPISHHLLIREAVRGFVRFTLMYRHIKVLTVHWLLPCNRICTEPWHLENVKAFVYTFHTYQFYYQTFKQHWHEIEINWSCYSTFCLKLMKLHWCDKITLKCNRLAWLNFHYFTTKFWF